MTSLKSSYTQRLDDMVGLLKQNHNITMHWTTDVVSDYVTLAISKQNCQGRAYHLRTAISRYDIEDDMHIEIIRNMIHNLEKSVKDSDDKVLTHFPVTVGSGGGGGAIGSSVIGGGGSGGIYGTTIAVDNSGHYLEQKKHFSDKDMMSISKFKEDSRLIIKSIYSSLPLSGYVDPMDNITPALVIAGGVYTSLYHNETVKDYDVFFLDFPLTQSKVMNAIDHEKESSPSRFVESDLNYLNNAGNKNIKRVVLDNLTKIQYIFTTYINRKELLNSFDAEHACASYQDDKFYISPLTFDCIKNKVLRSHKGNIIEVWRVDKFTKKGFRFASNRV